MISSSRYCIFNSFFQQLEFFFKPKATPRIATPQIENSKLKVIWDNLQQSYFPEVKELNEYRIVWSNKTQTRSLASCCVRKKVVRVANAMNLEESSQFLEALIYHEMCHAVLGPPKIVNGRRIMHGKDFKSLEKRHHGIPALDHWIKIGGWSNAVRKQRYLKMRRSLSSKIKRD